MRKFRWIYINPYNLQPCFVAYAGKTLVRVEDVKQKNTRLLSYEDLYLEQLP